MPTATVPAPKTQDRKEKIDLHPGQVLALQSAARTTLLLAGVRSGKSYIGPPWLLKEIHERGPGDYLVAAPTYPLLAKAPIPEMKRLFERKLRLGKYTGSPEPSITFHEDRAKQFFGYTPERDTVIRFCHAANPDALEAATYKAAWLDECGQKNFKLASWEAVQARLSLDRGRSLLTTRPYYMGWLKTLVYDRWRAGDTHYNVIKMRSIDNPRFPHDEWERVRRELPAWKFALMYEGEFTRPAGMIYDCFDYDAHTCKDFPIPDDWPRFVGLDFGGVNTAAVFFAEDPKTRHCYMYREYWPASKGLLTARPAKEHAVDLKKGEPRLPYRCVGGSKSEDQWRAEFGASGYHIHEPDIKDVEVGIDRQYSLLKSGRLSIFKSCMRFIDQLGSYSRPMTDDGMPTDGIEDKETYHLLDASRYILSWYHQRLIPITRDQIRTSREIAAW